MAPVEDTDFGVAHHVTAEDVEATLALADRGTGPSCSAVLITSPTYYGACSDVAGGPPCQSNVPQQAGSAATQSCPAFVCTLRRKCRAALSAKGRSRLGMQALLSHPCEADPLLAAAATVLGSSRT